MRTSKGLVIGFLLLGAEAVGASESLALTSLERLRYDPGTREIVLEAKGPITPLSHYREELGAWVIDFRNARKVRDFSLPGLPDGPIVGLTIKQLNPRWVRMAFRLEGHRGSPFSTWRMVADSYRVKLRPPRVARPLRRPVEAANFQGPAFATRAFEEAPSQRPVDDRAWRWRTMSQMLLSTNIGHFNRGPSLAGARLSYQGTHRSHQPTMRGYLLCHIEQQTLRFAESRYDYGSLVSSLALSHPVTPWLHVFEGGAMRASVANAFQTMSLLDTDLFGGVGTYGAGPANGLWYGTLSAERMAAGTLRDSYYGQSLRLGYQIGVASMDVQIQGTVQRVDPMILSKASYRAYVYSAVDRALSSRAHIGVRALLGTQQSPESFSWFTEGGPYLQATF